MSLISIPIYLFKNTVLRWWENISSPLTKVVITFLFSALAFLVFGVFGTFKQKISDQLNRDDLRVIRTEEHLYGSFAQGRLYSGLSEAVIWRGYSKEYTSFQQVGIAVDSLVYDRIPLLSYDEAPDFFSFPKTQYEEARPVVVFSRYPRANGVDFIRVDDNRIPAISLPMPSLISSHFSSPAVAIIPEEIAIPLLERGFIQHQIILPKKDTSVEDLEKMIKAYSEAENRQVNVISSVELLKNLHGFLRQQENARFFIGAVIAAILSLTLGSLSFLEFRQERYLFALLRSFGVKKFYLYVHYLLETSVLTFVGLWLAGVAILHFIPFLLTRYTFNPEVSELLRGISVSSSPEDVYTLVVAVSIGVFISSIPIAMGLRKQVGLYLL